jgi:hypothetical protein
MNLAKFVIAGIELKTYWLSLYFHLLNDQKVVTDLNIFYTQMRPYP